MSEDSNKPQKAKQRPLSPHLQVYKPQITSVTSILHRGFGVALMFGLLMMAWGLFAIASGAEAYESFTNFTGSVLGKIMLFGWTFAFFYHFCAGIRHFIMDTAAMMDLKSAYRSAYFVYAGAFLFTFAVWGCFYWCAGTAAG